MYAIIVGPPGDFAVQRGKASLRVVNLSGKAGGDAGSEGFTCPAPSLVSIVRLR
jgi:hypothetical protein